MNQCAKSFFFSLFSLLLNEKLHGGLQDREPGCVPGPAGRSSRTDLRPGKSAVPRVETPSGSSLHKNVGMWIQRSPALVLNMTPPPSPTTHHHHSGINCQVQHY